MNQHTPNADDTIGITERVEQYRRDEITWRDLVTIVKTYPWREPDLPDSGDYLGWDELPDTFQTGTWGEVTGLHLDELLSDDEYRRLMDAYDAIEDPLIKAEDRGRRRTR